MSDRRYQFEFSRDNPAMHSAEGRYRKARTMLAVLHDAIGRDALRHATVLNIGCSTGYIDEALAPEVRELVGIDIDDDAVEHAQRRSDAPNARFLVGDAMDIPFEDARFDVAICSQVYEHVPDPRRMIAEMHRVLRPGGIVYFAATNRYCVMEKHHHLPMLSVMPVAWAHRYLKLAGKGRYYHERHLGYGALRKLVLPFRIDDYTLRLLRAPDHYHFRYLTGTGVRAALIQLFARIAYPVFPGYIWILRKSPAEVHG